MAKRNLALQPQGTVRKKFILKCPPEMIKYSLNFRVPTNREADKFSMVIIPTLPQPPPVMDQPEQMKTTIVNPLIHSTQS